MLNKEKNVAEPLLSDDIVWEIFTNPNNLSIYITNIDQTYGFVIAQKNPYKKLDFFNNILSTQVSAIELAKIRLIVIQARGLKILNNPNDERTKKFNPDNKSVEELTILNDDLIVKINNFLKQNGEVDSNKL